MKSEELLSIIDGFTPGLKITNIKFDSEFLSMNINGKDYKYAPSNGLSSQEFHKKFMSIFNSSPGKALSFLKKNSDLDRSILP